MARQITELAVTAFLAGRTFKQSNTEVTYHDAKTVSRMYLFDNLIASYNHTLKELVITTAGWNTVTTRERLNGLPKVSVTQMNYQLYLNGEQWDGEPVTIEL